MITRLAHVNIYATDLAASEDFYCNILGMKKAFEFYKNDALYGFYLETGDTTFIEVFTTGGAEFDCQRPGIHHLCLEVDDLDGFIAGVRGKGWEVSDKKQGADQSFQCWITDPSGVRIEVMQYTENSSQFTGQRAEVTW